MGIFTVKKKVASGVDALMATADLLAETLVNGAPSIKLTEITSHAVGIHTHKTEQDTTVFLFTLPNGVSVGSTDGVIEQWLLPLIKEKLFAMEGFSPYAIVKELVEEIDKITVEVIDQKH